MARELRSDAKELDEQLKAGMVAGDRGGTEHMIPDVQASPKTASFRNATREMLSVVDRSRDSPRSHRALNQLRQTLRSRHYSRRTEQTYCQGGKRYIHFHNVRHPAEMSEQEINPDKPS
jgi:hypothetical protein